MCRQTMISAALLVGLVIVAHVCGEQVVEILRYDRDGPGWYAFLTASFVHGDVQHLLVNVAIFGSIVVLFHGELTARSLWLVTVVCAFTAVSFEHIFGKPPFMPYLIDETFGLSGACYGLLMYCAVARALRRDALGLFLGVILIFKVSVEAVHQGPLFYSSVEAPAVFGHVGGVVSGALLAAISKLWSGFKADRAVA
jgi:membrane associated rhomboid family serine protease